MISYDCILLFLFVFLSGDQVIVGICLPMGFAQTDKPESTLFRADGCTGSFKTAPSLNDLAESSDPSVNLYLDREMGVAYWRIWETKVHRTH